MYFYISFHSFFIYVSGFFVIVDILSVGFCHRMLFALSVYRPVCLVQLPKNEQSHIFNLLAWAHLLTKYNKYLQAIVILFSDLIVLDVEVLRRLRTSKTADYEPAVSLIKSVGGRGMAAAAYNGKVLGNRFRSIDRCSVGSHRIDTALFASPTSVSAPARFVYFYLFWDCFADL